MLRKRNQIIAAVNLRVAKTTHKHEIEVPCTVAEALKLDEKMVMTFGTMLCRKKLIMLKSLLIFYEMIKNFYPDIRKPVVILFMMYE